MATTIAEALKRLDQRIAERDEFRRFYRGEHGVHLRTPELRRCLDGHRPFAVNFCKVIVESLTDRIQVRAITADAGEEAVTDERLDEQADSEATVKAAEIWERSNLDVTALAWRYSVDGDAYLGLELAGGIEVDGTVTTEPTLKAIDGDKVAPLDDGSLFVVTGGTTGLLVAPDGMSAIHHELAPGGEWVPVIATDEDGGQYPATLVAQDADGNPLRIIYRITNGDTGDTWGSSDLAVAVPQQRAINARAIDIHEVSGNASWPQNWIVGKGASRAAGRIRTRAGAVHGVEAAEDGAMSLHQFAAADPTKLSATLDDLIEYLAVTSGTPLKSSGAGANSSAESRRIAQDRLTRRVMKALHALGEAIGAMMESALRAVGVDADVEVQWESPEPVSEKDSLETATMKLALGVSRYTLLKELGYDPEREALYRADEKAEEQVAMTRAITTGADTADSLAGLLGGGAASG